MARDDLFQPKQKIFCRELETGSGFTGFFEFSEERIETHLTSFGDPISISDGDRITLMTEDLQFVVLLGSFLMPGTRTKYSAPAAESKTLVIDSNAAVVGSSPWTSDLTVKKITFDVPGSDPVFDNNELISKLSGEHRYSGSDRRIIVCETDKMTVSVFYAASYGSRADFPTNWSPKISVDLKRAAPIDEVFEAIFPVSSFLSCMVGVALNWKSVVVSALDDAEIERCIEEQKNFDQFRLLHLQNEAGTPPSHFLGRSPFVCFDDDERAMFEQGLEHWISRFEQWRTAYVLMFDMLRNRATIGPERLLAACKCLEQIPGADGKNTMSDSEIAEVISSAQEKAAQLGFKQIEGRIKDALRRVAQEPHAERFRRLILQVANQATLGPKLQTMINDLKNAMRFRGHAAHRNLHSKTEEDSQSLYRAICAVECLCLLLLLKDLPKSPRSQARLERHPLVEDYIRAL